MSDETQPNAAEQTSVEKTSKFAKIKNINVKSWRFWRVVTELVLVAAVVVLAFMLVGLNKDKKDLNKQLSDISTNPQLAVQKQTQDLIKKVSEHHVLPTGETPTIAEVSDAAKAKQQSAFFNEAQNGDKVLLYVKAGEAILYRPSTDQVILEAPLTFSNTTGTQTTTPTKK